MSSADVESYIAECEPAAREALKQIRAAIREAAPAATERISYRMPAWDDRGIVAYAGAFTKHIGFYPAVEDPSLREEAACFAGPKGNLRFPLDEPMPLDLIRRIVQSRVQGRRSPGRSRARPEG